MARLTRAEFLRIKRLEFVGRRAIGARNAIMLQVILPNALPPLVVSATLAVGPAILLEAGCRSSASAIRTRSAGA